MRRLLQFLPLLLLAGPAGPAGGELRPDHERARAAVERGEILPLSAILPAVEAAYGGRIIEVEFEREGGIYVYEFDILTEDGRLFEVEVDAATGAVVEVEEEFD